MDASRVGGAGDDGTKIKATERLLSGLVHSADVSSTTVESVTRVGRCNTYSSVGRRVIDALCSLTAGGEGTWVQPTVGSACVWPNPTHQLTTVTITAGIFWYTLHTAILVGLADKPSSTL